MTHHTSRDVTGFDVTLGVAEADLNEVDRDPPINGGLFTHYLNVSESIDPVLLSIYPRSRQHSLQVFVRFNEEPTNTSYDFRFTVSRFAMRNHRVKPNLRSLSTLFLLGSSIGSRCRF